MKSCVVNRDRNYVDHPVRLSNRDQLRFVLRCTSRFTPTKTLKRPGHCGQLLII